MTSADLKKLLDEYRNKISSQGLGEIYHDGFQDAVELLLPCLEALEKLSHLKGLKYFKMKTWTREELENAVLYDTEIAGKALINLEHKLKGEV